MHEQSETGPFFFNLPNGDRDPMTQKKDRDRVMAEITLPHLLRLANEHGCSVSREQALAFLNEQGRAFEMWKHMMQAGEDFIKDSFLRSRFILDGKNDGFRLRQL